MGKYLLLIAGVIVVYWLVRSSLRRRREAEQSAKAIAEDMVRCAQCGVHLPRGESLAVRGKFFCCDDHRQRYDGGNA